MNSLFYTDVLFENDDSWGAFQLQHGVNHEGVYEAMLRNDLSPFYLDLFTFPREDNKQYLLDHYQAHLSNATLLNLPGIPDLSTVDFSDSDQREDWLSLHAIVHDNENAVLGLI